MYAQDSTLWPPECIEAALLAPPSNISAPSALSSPISRQPRSLAWFNVVMDSPYLVIAFSALLAVTAVALWKRRMRSSLPFPPGPRPLPILGNLFDMPTKQLSPSLRDMADKYGTSS